ncbi:NAD+ synthase [Methanolinea mesophila]|uniref:NAD+ synthase n=1 Tax=Methanolinea mesophila TaxID=547055 RepID=UPI001AE7E79A|nr:NAD+ synthase [Methanolinea mesophila]MBP1929326.1 NAD+ synthase [Methanolinea mesophila]
MKGDLGCAMGRIEQMIRYTLWNSGAGGIVIGISGGIDSAVAAAFCEKAIGGGNILGLSMPSAVSREEDLLDARALCEYLGISHMVVRIDPMLDAYRAMPGFMETPYLTGNLMARSRMAILYYYANRDRRLVCGTSNRSEFLLGYTTKYGDNAGDFQPILHLLKTEVVEVAQELGIPEAIIKKAPSAGLWPGQSDEGEIGMTYAEIDTAIRALEAQEWRPKNNREEKVLEMVKKSEHKRLPAPSLVGIC